MRKVKLFLFKCLLFFLVAPICQRCRQEEGFEQFQLDSWSHTCYSAQAAFFSHPRNKSWLIESNTENASLPHPLSTLHCSPLPFQTLPPFSKCLRLMETWGCKGPQRSSCPALLPLPAPVLRVTPIWDTDLQLCETNACYSPCSLLCPYSAMATYSATCANNSPAQGINMANSIANLRLKAKEYSLQRNQVPTVNWGKK